MLPVTISISLGLMLAACIIDVLLSKQEHLIPDYDAAKEKSERTGTYQESQFYNNSYTPLPGVKSASQMAFTPPYTVFDPVTHEMIGKAA